MTDVEKYGLFAVVLVGGLLVVIGVQGGFSSSEHKAIADAGAPVVMDAPAPLHPQSTDADAGSRVVRVKSILPDKPFQWDEAPAPYPGERSSDRPATVSALGSAPASSTVLAPAGNARSAPATGSGTHTVVAGETLSDIAAKCLGSKNRWQELVNLNPGLNPKKLQIGQVLRVADDAPAASAPATSPTTSAVTPATAATTAPAAPASATSSAKGRTHTVVAGDTLSSIAKKYLGSTARADDIYAANRDVLKSPDALKLGQTLKIP